MATSARFVISLGGSLINPGTIDARLLRRFSAILARHARLGKKFVVFTGGGALTRELQRIASSCGPLTADVLDLIGIQPTRINALLLRQALGTLAAPRIIENPSRKTRLAAPVTVGSGWKPGASTDHCAVTFAVTHGIRTVINISNTDHVYDSDPRTNKNARALRELNWRRMRQLMGTTWSPGLNRPFDPVATRLAQRHALTVVFLGPDLSNLQNYLLGRRFEGTTVR